MNFVAFTQTCAVIVVVSLFVLLGAMQPVCSAESFEDFLVEKAHMARPDAPADPFEVLSHQEREKAQWALRYLTRTSQETQQNLSRLVTIARGAAEKAEKGPFPKSSKKSVAILDAISDSIQKTPDLTRMETMIKTVEPVIYDALDGKLPGLRPQKAIDLYFKAVMGDFCVVLPAIPSVERFLSKLKEVMSDPEGRIFVDAATTLTEAAYRLPQRREELLEELKACKGEAWGYDEAKDFVEHSLRKYGEPMSREVYLSILQEDEKELEKGVLSSYGNELSLRCNRMKAVLQDSPNRVAVTKRLLADPVFARRQGLPFLPDPIFEDASADEKKEHDEFITFLAGRVQQGEFWAINAIARMVSPERTYGKEDTSSTKGGQPYGLERVVDVLLNALASEDYEVADKIARTLDIFFSRDSAVSSKIYQGLLEKKERMEKELGISKGDAFKDKRLGYHPEPYAYEAVTRSLSHFE